MHVDAPPGTELMGELMPIERIEARERPRQAVGTVRQHAADGADSGRWNDHLRVRSRRDRHRPEPRSRLRARTSSSKGAPPTATTRASRFTSAAPTGRRAIVCSPG